MPRKLAHRVLMRLEDGAFSHILLNSELEKSQLSGPDRALASKLVYGTMARQRTLDRLIEGSSDRPVRKFDQDVKWALRMAAYQLTFLDRIPNHAIVDESVELVHETNPRAKGFVNAVARRLSERELKAEDAPAPADRQKKPVRWLGDRHSVPNWLANRVLQSSGGIDRAEPILAAMNVEAPIWLYSDEEIPDTDAHDAIPHARRSRVLHDAARTALEEGNAFVQDLGAQLICWYCGDVVSKRVLDTCAGLGGKSLHLASRGANMTLVEPKATKLGLFEEQRVRLGLAEAETFEGKLEAFESDSPYDVVLVDAPCSALGIIRRHPETRWTRDQSSILECARQQAELLDQATQHVAPGGALVYAVCTFTPEETTKQIDAFLERHPDWRRAGAPGAPFEWDEFIDDDGDLVLAPHTHDTDGFYACRLQRSGD